MTSRAHTICRFVLLWAAFCSGAAHAAGAPDEQPQHKLAELINAYRSSPQQCNGETKDPAGPLAPNQALARVEIAPGGSSSPAQALQRAGYSAARVQFIVLTGPQNAEAAMATLRNKYCRELLDTSFADIGVSLEGRTWRIVLARPLLSPDLGDWREAGKAVLSRVNAARKEPRNCGERHFAAAGPVKWNEKLADAALAHSRDMAEHNYFAHRARDGSQVSERATRQGYRWQRVGENIATGQGGPEQVMRGWLASPHHCANIMAPAFTEMGAAFAMNPQSDTTIYWTQVFGTPR